MPKTEKERIWSLILFFNDKTNTYIHNWVAHDFLNPNKKLYTNSEKEAFDAKVREGGLPFEP
jgi:hypothetical protein